MKSAVITSAEEAYLAGWMFGTHGFDLTKTGLTVGRSERDILFLLATCVPEDLSVDSSNEFCESLELAETEFLRRYHSVIGGFSQRRSPSFLKALLEERTGLKQDAHLEPAATRELLGSFLDDFFGGRDDLKFGFIRGCVDSAGVFNRLTDPDKKPKLKLILPSSAADVVSEFVGTAKRVDPTCLLWEGNNCLDFLGSLYENEDRLFLKRNKAIYREWCIYHPSSAGTSYNTEVCSFKWKKLDDRAVAPSKTNVSDSGYDLVLIEKIKQSGNVEFYTTGISVSPGFGWAFDLVGRSSISKSGYMMANNIGIIDRTYQGPLIVGLIKVDPAAPELELPSRLVQIVPRTIAHLTPVEVPRDDDFDGVTSRAEGGFGSTGK